MVLVALVSPARAADPIQRVEVRLAIDGGDPHPQVVRRILESIGSAAERLLVGRDSEVAARQEAALTGVLREVTDRVVRGYRVVEMGLAAGVTTVLTARLQPLPPILGEMPVAFTLQGVHPDAQPLVREALDPALPALGRLAARLPADALEWAGPILARQVIEIVEGAADGFSGVARIEVTPPRIALILASRDARVIRDIGIRFRSTSIPNTLLDRHAPQVASMAEPLRGLPVAFASAHRARLEALLARRLEAYPPAHWYGIVARPTLQIGEVTYVTVLADSTVYRARFEARLNFGTQAPPADVRVQFGRAYGSLEPFLQATLVPSTLAVSWAAGVRFELGTQLTVGAAASLTGGGIESMVTYRLSPDLQLRGAFESSTDVIETTLSYRINEFLSWEGVATSRGIYWLRMVGNL
ncbi:MAG: hypothetical protein QN168_03090 [Armatimonadota bacterium]|nr:hypothetical protein [Armatimonadota bacterium]